MTKLRTIVLLIAVTSVGATACAKKDTAGKAPVAAAPVAASADGRIAIKVTDNGFEPANVSVPAGKPVTLVFTRTTEHTCATEVVMQIGDQPKTTTKLPLNQAVEIAATFPKAGVVNYACAMDMTKGVITVQ